MKSAALFGKLTSRQNVTENLLYGLINERRTADQKFVEANAEGPDVDSGCVVPSLEDFWRQVVRRTEDATLT